MSLYLGNTPIAHSQDISGKANLNLDNSTAITNCITEIPQDIKLELNNGTLTLKAGSKVYVPNGVGVFDAVTTSADHSLTNTSNDTYMVFAKSNGSGLELARLANQTGSGTTTPTSSWWVYYNTSDNKVYRIENGVNTRQVSLPIAIITVSGGAISSIDQVFNGFGYIGSTVFALPGVKGLIANGRNADGTLKNIEWNYTAVKTHTFGTNQNGFFYIKTNYAASIIDYTTNFVVSDTQPTVTGTTLWYNPVNNIISRVLANGTVNINYREMPIGYIILSSGVITSFTPKTAFHALDYNDSPTISGWSMPSSRYINLTLGASGATYTAPANGWAMVTQAFSDSCYIGLATVYPDKDGICMSSQYNSAAVLNAYIPVSKGETFKVFYGGTKVADSENRFVFIYAEGEN